MSFGGGMTEETISSQAMQAAMIAAAGRLILIDPAKWAGWLTYLLEVLDNNVPADHDYSAVLAAVADAIDGRLESGSW